MYGVELALESDDAGDGRPSPGFEERVLKRRRELIEVRGSASLNARG